jgi:hypothetical protein
VSDAEQFATEASDVGEEWPYAVTPADEDAQRQFSRRELKMLATNGEIYAGSRARAMVEYAEQVPDQPRWIGATERDNRDVSLPYDLLFRHLFVGGLTGMGKSTLLKNIVQQHIYAGKGVCFIDPKGDDVLDILMSVPRERWDDVIFISPGDDAFRKRVGFNLLETHTEPGESGFDAEVEGIVNDLKALLASDDYWGPLMDGVASNMLRGMIRHEFDFTLADMFGALLDEESRAEYANLIAASDEDLSFIQGYTDKIAELEDIDLDAIRRRLKDWVEEPTMRQIVAQRDAQISIPQAVEDEKIILVNNNLPDEPKEAVATAILRQVWTAVDSRPSDRDQLMQDIAEADEGGVGRPRRARDRRNHPRTRGERWFTRRGLHTVLSCDRRGPRRARRGQQSREDAGEGPLETARSHDRQPAATPTRSGRSGRDSRELQLVGGLRSRPSRRGRAALPTVWRQGRSGPPGDRPVPRLDADGNRAREALEAVSRRSLPTVSTTPRDQGRLPAHRSEPR